MVKSVNAFLTQKIIEIDGVKYTSYEKMPVVGTNNWIVSLREVKLIKSVCNVAGQGPVYGYVYNLVHRSLRRAIDMKVWEKSEDVNKANTRIELSR